MRRYSRVLLPLLLCALFVSAVPVEAQFTTANPITLEISPQNPRPYETVTVTPDSQDIDLLASTIAVSVNGKVIEKGTGAQSVPVTIGGPGEKTAISVSATTAGKTYTNSVTLRPADVALVIEPISSTHPFYLGAALTAPSSRVRIIALADLRTTPLVRLDPNSLIYTWKLGDQILESDSGIGRSTLVATAPVRYRDAQITVTVTNADSTLIAESSTTVSPVDPIVRIYPNDALMGPDFDHALSGTYTMNDAEEAFRGVAYYFGTAPTLAWSINNQVASSDKDVTVRTTGSGQGTATVSFVANNSDTLQKASQDLGVHFGAEKSTNIFGF